MDFDEPMEAETIEEEPVKVKAEVETASTVKVEPKTEPKDEMLMYVCNTAFEFIIVYVCTSVMILLHRKLFYAITS